MLEVNIYEINEDIHEIRHVEDIIEIIYIGIIVTDNDNNDYFLFLNENTGKIDLTHDLGGKYDNSMIY